MTVDVFDVLFGDEYFLTVGILVLFDVAYFLILDFKDINDSIPSTSD